VDGWTAGHWTAIGGLVIGMVTGAAAFHSNFCGVGAVADIVLARDWRRMQAWMLALGVALVGTQALDAAGMVVLADSLYVQPRVAVLALVIGGVLFGFGMTLTGGCGNRALVRLGAGSLKSLVTLLVLGLASAATLYGVLNPLATVIDTPAVIATVAPDIHTLAAEASGVARDTLRWIFAAPLAAALLFFSLRDSWFRGSSRHVIGGVVIGLMIPAAWALTGAFANDPMQPIAPAALNFVIPVGSTIIYGMTAMASPLAFAEAVVIGVPIGAFVIAFLAKDLQLETFTDRGDLTRHLSGAALMGFGGTLCLGCTFGQGLSGLSTLAVGSLLAVPSMIAGCLWGIRYLETGGLWSALKLTLVRGFR
jgi:uncharacterized membrane protein YedE/YeeE